MMVLVMGYPGEPETTSSHRVSPASLRYTAGQLCKNTLACYGRERGTIVLDAENADSTDLRGLTP